MYKIEVGWSGAWPCLCSGRWFLSIDGVDLSDTVPFQEEPAYTRHKGSYWYFDEEYLEQWETKVDGLSCEEWCEKHGEWLGSIAPKEAWKSIFEAFKACDWRHGECGGCI